MAVTFVVPGAHLMSGLLGERDEHLRFIEGEFEDVAIRVRGNEVSISGPQSDVVSRLFEELTALLQRGESLDRSVLSRSIVMVQANEKPSLILTEDILRTSSGKNVRAKTSGQRKYVEAIRDNVITFGIGPAGTGKSWLAVAMAVLALNTKRVQRIILTRPAVEAGERLGFLPGDLTAKIDPYLRPLFDALHDMIDVEAIPRLMQTGVIEVAPLAFMRGRTLNDAFIILDEAQNTTPEQMKMFLTRLGFGSKMVITGDVTQTDLPNGQRSGLAIIRDILGGVADISFMDLTTEDVVRHRLIGDIVKAYDTFEATKSVPRPIRNK